MFLSLLRESDLLTAMLSRRVKTTGPNKTSKKPPPHSHSCVGGKLQLCWAYFIMFPNELKFGGESSLCNTAKAV